MNIYAIAWNYISEYLTYGVVVFFIVNLVNVMLSTVKSILTIKSTRQMASLVNAISYGFYALIVKQMANYDLMTIVIITIIANLIGVYTSMWLLDKFKKDRLWKITVIVTVIQAMLLKESLLNEDLGFNQYPIQTKFGQSIAFDIFTKSQKESGILKNVLSDYTNVKYYIAEIDKRL